MRILDVACRLYKMFTLSKHVTLPRPVWFSQHYYLGLLPGVDIIPGARDSKIFPLLFTLPWNETMVFCLLSHLSKCETLQKKIENIKFCLMNN